MIKQGVKSALVELGMQGSILCICKSIQKQSYTAIIKPPIEDPVYGDDVTSIDTKITLRSGQVIEMASLQTLIYDITNQGPYECFLDDFSFYKDSPDCMQFDSDGESIMTSFGRKPVYTIIDFLWLLNRENKLSKKAITYLLLVEYGIKSVELSDFFNLLCKEQV